MSSQDLPSAVIYRSWERAASPKSIQMPPLSQSSLGGNLGESRRAIFTDAVTRKLRSSVLLDGIRDSILSTFSQHRYDSQVVKKGLGAPGSVVRSLPRDSLETRTLQTVIDDMKEHELDAEVIEQGVWSLMELAKGETIRVADQTEWPSADRSVVLNISDVTCLA